MYSALEGDHIFRVEERSHPFFRDGLLKFCISFIVARKQVLPHDGSAGGVDDLKRPIGFVFEPNNRDLDGDAVLFHRPRQARMDKIWFSWIHRRLYIGDSSIPRRGQLPASRRGSDVSGLYLLAGRRGVRLGWFRYFGSV